MNNHNRQEQATAILLGLAIGDALGYPVEFSQMHQIKAKYGEQGIQEPPSPVALYSDDTQMTLALVEGLLAAGLDAPLDVQMKAVADQFVIWKHSPENNRAPGNTCMRALSRYEEGAFWRDAGIVESKGCGSCMRVAPLGYFYQHDVDRLREVAVASGEITHRHPAAIAASIAGAYLVKLALDGVAPENYIREVMAFTEGISDEHDQALLRVGHVLGWTDEEAAMNHLGQGWVAEESIALALYCILRYPDDYVACMRRAANSPGDSDSIACIAGGIMGARLGLAAIPENWRVRCENYALLLTTAERMAQSLEG